MPTHRLKNNGSYPALAVIRRLSLATMPVCTNFQTGEAIRQRRRVRWQALHNRHSKITTSREHDCTITSIGSGVSVQQPQTIQTRLRNFVAGKVYWEVFPRAVESELYPQFHKAIEQMVRFTSI